MFNSKRSTLLTLCVCLALAFSLNLEAQETSYPQSTFIVNLSSSLPELRPHLAYNADEAQIFSALYEGLFVYDPFSMDPIPALAESWIESTDGLEWQFTIRENALFSNGDPISAQTIHNAWIALLHPNLQAPYASLFDCIQGVLNYRTGKTADSSLIGITTVGNTLILRLTSPTSHLPKILCHHAFSAVHPSDYVGATKTPTDGEQYPIASGPFILESFSQENMLFTKNSRYWDAENVALPAIKIIFDEDTQNLTSGYNRGEIHWLAGSVEISKILDGNAIKLSPMFSTEYFFFRTTWGPWQDEKIRNALLQAVPWELLRSGYLVQASTLIFPISGYPELIGISEYNIETAKIMMIEAGVKSPTDVPPIIIRIPEAESYFKLAGILKEAWEAIGLKVEIKSIPYANYYANLRLDDYTIGVTSWIGDFADPMSFLEMFRPNSTLNDSGWNNKEFEKLIIEGSAEKRKTERYATLSKAEEMILNEGVILPISHNPALNIIDTDGIKGWYSNPLDIHPFKFIEFKQKSALPGVARK